MSGIVGIYRLDQRPAQSDELRKMLAAIAHRGPDGSDAWCDGPVGLGHRMLWTTPESLIEKMPLLQARLTITADARIDNRDQLIPQLDLGGRPAEKVTDSDIILAAYRQWGARCPEKLLGDFAFAIWDAISQQLFCARDHFGVKPFYYHYRPGKIFAFASEIKALLCLPGIPRRLDQIRLGDYLTVTMADKAITTFEQIRRLCPAHSLTVTQTRQTAQCYWQLEAQTEISLPSDQAYAQQFHDIFTEAVRCRLRSAFPVASQLSGGLDSSAVTCVAQKLLSATERDPLHTISAIFDTVTDCDERPFIESVLADRDLVAHYIPGDKTSPLTDIETILQYEDEAYIGPNHFYPWIANRAAQTIGARVVLDGFDGDTTVSHGIARLTELASQGDWETLVQECVWLAEVRHTSASRLIRQYGLPHLHNLLKQGNGVKFIKTVQRLHRRFDASRRRLIVNYGLKPLIASIGASIGKHWFSRSAVVPAPAGLDLVDPNFAEKIGLKQRMSAEQPVDDRPLTLRQSHWRSLTHGILPFTLEQVDRYAASFSLEARHPFMDKRLIEFCLALPAEQKLSQGFGRMVMRQALDGILPEQVQWRPDKADLSPNFDDGFLRRDRKTLDEIMSTKVKNLKTVNQEVLQAAYQRMVSAPAQVSSADRITVWKAVILTLSLEHKNLLPHSPLADRK